MASSNDGPTTDPPQGEPRPKARSAKGERTRARILQAAEDVFGQMGYHDASIVEITRRAGIALGTFYVYFASKKAIFDELIHARGEELRQTLRHSAAAAGPDRRDMEAAGFRAYFEWIRAHPTIYRVARQAEFVDPELLRDWYRIFAEDYTAALAQAMDAGEIRQVEPETMAWAVMGMADFVAMRFLVWEDAPMREEQLEDFVRIAMRLFEAPEGRPAPA